MRHDSSAIQPLFAVVAVGLIIVFAMVAFAASAYVDNSPKAPIDQDSDGDGVNDGPIGYIQCGATVAYYVGGPSAVSTQEGAYSFALGVGTHAGTPVQETTFFVLPDELIALSSHIAVTFNVYYPNGEMLTDTQVVSSFTGSHTFESVAFMVYETGNYMVEAYLFVDGTQYGEAHTQGVSINGSNWNED